MPSPMNAISESDLNYSEIPSDSNDDTYDDNDDSSYGSGFGTDECNFEFEFDDFNFDDDTIENDDDDDDVDTFPPLPFWFGTEDHDQVMQIMNMYDDFLNLEKERKSCVRKPEPFVGCVCRYQVKGSSFQTLDKIKIYQKEILPPGKDMTVYKVKHVLVKWDVETGLPTNMTLLKKIQRDYWEKRCHSENYSYLYCIPFRDDCRAQFFCSRTEKNMMYANDQFTYAPYVKDKLEELNNQLESLCVGDNIYSASPPIR